MPRRILYASQAPGNIHDHPQCDYQRAEQCSVQKQSAMPVAVNPGQHVRKLQSDQNKDYAVEDEVESFPNRPGLSRTPGEKKVELLRLR